METQGSLTPAVGEQFGENLPADSTLRQVSLPVPTLKLDFKMCVQLNPRISVGEGVWGQRNWISFRGGHWTASWGSGIVKPGGQDSQLVTKSLATHLETNYLLQTNDDNPAFIVVRTQGWRTGPPDVLAKLFDPVLADGVDPTEYIFRLFIHLETGDERYSFLNTALWIGSGARRGAEVIYDAYRVH